MGHRRLFMLMSDPTVWWDGNMLFASVAVVVWERFMLYATDVGLFVTCATLIIMFNIFSCLWTVLFL